ncbi:MAG TPA: TRZ/ATZ family hydrolase [Rhodocyclaceae bacterium]|nr:TRZ/ATZ family hydrolase [Rhodocyclaceae bacterium]HMV53112.1 TRZ/ATZ family hydrolase [Rhodocyclaceae bacterium]HNA03854.1 TRZ/ATZ family hydrolase [Rhodocyclaceae bacterium]HNB79385.1 TRZ/ATZ family hydrolase [Rhodocyclaceae bacterium]HNC61357.1 TRZ/ATZ family hydrolase [Rhodocyclaceae bacterium]
MPESIDVLVEARWVIPIEPPGSVLEHHGVAVCDGRIVDILPIDAARTRYPTSERVSLPDHVLLPGLVNAHTHAAMTLMRGLGDDQPLMRWLQDTIWPAEGRHVSEDFVRDGTLLACFEMLRGGVTCFSDMYFYPDAAAKAAATAGMRCMLGVIAVEFPTVYAADAHDYLAKGLATRDAWRDHELVNFCIAPHAPYTVSDKTFERIRVLAEQLDLPIHMHIHETAHEIDESIARHGVRPLARLTGLGLVGPSLIGVHAVHLNPDEIELLARHDCSIVHCPSSNLKLASGIAPVAALKRAGVRVALGTDGAASNNRLDLLEEMRLAALLGKCASGDAAALPAHDSLRMATLDGAAALGLARQIGSIERGKLADMIAVDLGGWITSPCYDPASHLVYVAGREQVSHVWVGGQLRMAECKMLQIDNIDLRQLSTLWQNKMMK